MERSELLISLTPSAEKQLQTATAHQRIMTCITKKLPITESIFTGLTLLEDKDRERLLRIAEEHIRTMDLPSRSSLLREIETTSLKVRQTLEKMDEERRLLPDDLAIHTDNNRSSLPKAIGDAIQLEYDPSNHG